MVKSLLTYISFRRPVSPTRSIVTPLQAHSTSHTTVLVLRIAHRIWKETKQHPCKAGPDNMLGSCLVSFHFLLAILSTVPVLPLSSSILIIILRFFLCFLSSFPLEREAWPPRSPALRSLARIPVPAGDKNNRLFHYWPLASPKVHYNSECIFGGRTAGDR